MYHTARAIHPEAISRRKSPLPVIAIGKTSLVCAKRLNQNTGSIPEICTIFYLEDEHFCPSPLEAPGPASGGVREEHR